MQLAQKFRRPIVVFIDTPAAYPGVESEERGVAEAIAFNLREMFMLEVPIVVIVCGEGGSGGALGIAIGDRVFMQEYSVYSVIPPEGCAAILWRDSEPQGRGRGGPQDHRLRPAVARTHRRRRAGAGGRRAQQLRRGDGARRSGARPRRSPSLSTLGVDELLAGRYDKFRRMGREGQAFVDTADRRRPAPRPARNAHEVAPLAAPAV